MTAVHGFCAMHAYAWLEAEGTVPRPAIHEGIALMSAHGQLAATGHRVANECTMSTTGSLSVNGTVVPSPNKESRQVRAGRSGIRGPTVRGRVR